MCLLEALVNPSLPHEDMETGDTTARTDLALLASQPVKDTGEGRQLSVCCLEIQKARRKPDGLILKDAKLEHEEVVGRCLVTRHVPLSVSSHDGNSKLRRGSCDCDRIHLKSVSGSNNSSLRLTYPGRLQVSTISPAKSRSC